MKTIMTLVWIIIGALSLGILITSVIHGNINMIRIFLPIFIIAILTLMGYHMDD